jgi:peptidoglycan/xylan/chitin deacetylase (PgdA/CDA1 family)
MKLSIPILMYHQVSPVAHPKFLKFTVTTEAFAAQMSVLRRLGFNPITFNTLTGYKQRLNPLPSKPIIITFDDVFEDAIENAVPILKNVGFKAVFYAPTEFVGKTSSWMLPDVGVEFQLINWPQLRDLDAKGFEIGSHTMTHPYLNKIPSEDCYIELERSRNILEEHLDHEVKHMAYPYGYFNGEVKAAAKQAGYITACAALEKLTNINDDLLCLPRLNVGMEDSLLDYVLKIHTAYSINGVYKNRSHILRSAIPAPVRRFIKKLTYKQKTK